MSTTSTKAVCPRCLAEVTPDMERCHGCNQVLKRPSETASPKLVTTKSMASRSSIQTLKMEDSSSGDSSSDSVRLDSTTVVSSLDRGTPGPPTEEKIRVVCACGTKIRVSASAKGRRVKCPKCSAKIPVPTTPSISASSDAHRVSSLDRPSSAVPIRQQSSSADSSATHRSTESAVNGRTSVSTAANSISGELSLRHEIESAAKLSVPADAVPPAGGRLSSLKLRKLQKTLEATNVLNDEDNVARRLALLELGKSQDREVLEILIEHAQEAFPIIREGAITALGELGDPAGVPSALKALLDRDNDVIRAAFATLKKIGDSRAVRPLLRYGIERAQWKPLANDTIVRMGSRIVPELLNLLHTNDAALVMEAVIVLGRIGDRQAGTPLVQLLPHASDSLRARIAEALALIGVPSFVPQLLQLLQDACPAVRANAASGLARLVDHRAFRPLVNALSDENAEVRRYAAIALGELGEPKAVPELVRLLQRWELLLAMDAPFVEAVIETIGRLGDDTAAPSLLPLLQSHHEGVMLKTVLALKRLRSPAAVPALTGLLNAPQPMLRRRAVETLGLTGDPSLVPLIGDILRRDASLEVRAMAARSLGELKSPEAITFLEDALREEFAVRCQAIIALGAIQERSTIPALMAMLKDEAPEVRYHALNAIAKFKDPKTLRALAVMLEDPDQMVRSAASKVVQEFDDDAKDKTVKTIIRRARSRNLWDKLVPKWVYLIVPSSKAALSALAVVLLVSLLGFGLYKLWVGGPKQIILRGNVAALSMSPDGGILIAERTRGMLEVWDIEGERVKEQLTAESGGTPRFRKKDGLVLVSAESLIPWNLSGLPDSAAGWKEHQKPIEVFYTTPGGEFAASMDQDRTVVVWDLEAGRKSGQLKLDERFNQSLTVSPNGTLLAASSATGEVAVWDVDSGDRIQELPRGKVQRRIAKLSFNSEGTWLVGAELNGGLRIFDLQAKSRSAKNKTIELDRPLVPVDVRFLQDDKRVLIAEASGNILVWDSDSGESTVVCKTGISPLDGFALSSDEKRLAAGSSESSEIAIFELDSGKRVKTLDVD